MNLKSAVTGLVVFALAAMANASVVAEWDAGVSVTEGSFTGTKYTLTLTSNQGPIYAMDMKIVAANPGPGHAFYNESYREGKIFEGGPPSSYDVDTLFLFDGSDLTIGNSGENDTTPPDEDWDYTSDLYAAWSFTQGVGAFTSAPVAQIILPACEPAPTLEMLFNTNDSQNNAWAVTNDGSGDVKVAVTPEPATMLLLACGGVMALKRRKNP